MGLGMRDIFELILWVTFIDFIFCGMIVASSMWFLCNKVTYFNFLNNMKYIILYL